MLAEYLLVADLDGALLGDLEASERFAEWYREAAWRVRLAYVSRHAAAAMREAVAQSRLPEPDALIGLSGADIEFFRMQCSADALGLVPEGAGIGPAAEILASHWRISSSHVIVCPAEAADDSLFQHGFNGVIVNNAADDLRRLQGPKIYQARRAHAAGVLEGVGRWMADGKILSAFA